MSYFKTVFCLIPRRVLRHTRIDDWQYSLTVIGWVWLKVANLTKNYNHGWVCFESDIHKSKEEHSRLKL